MKTHGILFTAPMVQAIRDGRKTQTRRPVMPIPIPFGTNGDWMKWKGVILDPEELLRQSSISIGDTIAVRETWAALRLFYDYDTGICDDWCECDPLDVLNYQKEFAPSKPSYCIEYQANDSFSGLSNEERGFRWRPSIHMPLWACRFRLPVVNVRVERLRDISDADAQAEGVEHRWLFAGLWDACYAKRGYGWGVNPWVWVYEWEPCKGVKP